MLQQCPFPVIIVLYSCLCFPEALILGTATHGSIPSHETPLPVPIKSILFNKCWEKSKKKKKKGFKLGPKGERVKASVQVGEAFLYIW